MAITTVPTLTDPTQGYPSQATIAERNAYAKALLASGMEPVHNWGEGVGDLASSLVGGLMMRKANAADSAAQGAADAQSQAILAQMFGGGADTSTVNGAPISSPLPTTSDPMDPTATSAPSSGPPNFPGVASAAVAADPSSGALPATAPRGPDPVSAKMAAAYMANPRVSAENKAAFMALWKQAHPGVQPDQFSFPQANGQIFSGSQNTGKLTPLARVPPEPGFTTTTLNGRLYKIDKNTGEATLIDQAPPEPTTDIQNFEYNKAHGGELGAYQTEQKKAGATQIQNNVGPTGINYGQPDPGYAFARNADGTVKTDERGAPIELPVGPKLAEQQAADAAAENKAKNKGLYADVVTNNIDRVIETVTAHPNSTSGLGAWAIAWAPGNRAYDTSKLLETIKANVAFDRLNTLRESSATGASGLGSLTTHEEDMLSSVLGNMDQYQRADQLTRNLKDVKDVYTALLTTGIQPGDPLSQRIQAEKAARDSGGSSGGAAPSSADIEAEMRRRGLIK